MSSDTASVASSRFPGSGVTTKRKVDDRVKALIDDVSQRKHRGLVLLVGDRGREQIVNLHQMISRANHNAKVNVLWCMKEDPEFGSTSRKRQERKARLEVKGGLATEATKESFQTFLAQTQIRFCKYKETHKVLGQTFGMVVLQDFEAISPNTLARTVETVKGGGLIVIMFRGMRSLRKLYTIAMDVHARYRTEALRDVVPRFNERFVLSLTDCSTALCVDDDLNVLPITEKMKNYGKHKSAEYDAELARQGRLQHEVELLNLKEKLKPSAEVGPIVNLCQTMDQAKTVLSLMQTVTEKTLDATCVVTAGRGRGKSAALGMMAAGAIVQGYSNILCTAPSPENVQTFFEFAVRTLAELGYKERVDYEALVGTSEDFAKCIIRINVFREHRQTIQFVSATDSAKFSQAELLIVDEAAALPLTLVKKMMGPYLVVLASTISGYEGTGRSLSLKLVADLRKRAASGSNGGAGSSSSSGTEGQRSLKEIEMSDPIRYAPHDPVEHWLNKLLCLEATNMTAPLRATPHPSSCELYYVNRDALFSYHPLAEAMLQRIQSLLVAAHYKNQPNDLQLLSDAPGHHLFILCADSLTDKGVSGSSGSDGGVPDIYCLVHACEEGQISSEALRSQLSRGLRPSGDLIPYTLSQQYMEEGFAKLAGLRIVRIATNPEVQHSGYGSRALELLKLYYSGSISLNPLSRRDAVASARPATHEKAPRDGDDDEEADDKGEELMPAPRAKVPNLLTPLVDRPYEPMDYLGVSFGLTTSLFNFWKRAGFDVLYVRQAANELTSEHSAVMVCPMGFDLAVLRREFRRRFLGLLSMPFRTLPTELALSVLSDVDVHDAQKLMKATDATLAVSKRLVLVNGVQQADGAELAARFTESDRKRLRMFSTHFVESGNVLDLVPVMARLYFEGLIHKKPDGGEGVVLSHAQAAALLAVGLQCITLDELSTQSAFHGVPVQQLRAFFHKACARLVEHFAQIDKIAGTTRGADGAGEADGSPATAGKRAREEDATKDGLEEEEEAREIFDAAGNLVGLSVAKKVRKTVSVDATLLRDASKAVRGAEDANVHKDLQDYFRRPKKAKHQ